MREKFYKRVFGESEYDLFFTYHPAAALYDKSKESIIQSDLITLKKFLNSDKPNLIDIQIDGSV